GDVDGELAHRLAGIDQVRNAKVGAHVSYGLRILYEPGVRGNPAQGHQARPGVTGELADAFRVHAAFGPVVRPNRLDAGPTGEREVHELVRGIVGAGRDDAIAGAEVKGGHRLIEGDRGILYDRDVLGGRPDDPSEQLVRLVQSRLGFIGGFVAADRGLALAVPREPVRHR